MFTTISFSRKILCLLFLSLTVGVIGWRVNAERWGLGTKLVRGADVTTTANRRPVSPVRETIARKLRTQDKVKVELFVMSQCPFGVRAEEAMAPVLAEFGEQVDFQLRFIATPTGDGFTSMHGQPEVDEDIRQTVMAARFPQQYFDYVVARAGEYRNATWQPAAQAVGINATTVEELARSAAGRGLFAENIRRANELHITASPTILLDGEKYTGKILPAPAATTAYGKTSAAFAPSAVKANAAMACTQNSDCNDNSACTVDSCDTTTGNCSYTQLICDDSNACTKDTCDPAQGCVYTPINCDDGNPNTIDSCDRTRGCVNTPCPTIPVTNPTTTTGALGVAFNQSFTQTGGIGNVSFTTSSTLPAGLTLGSNGTLSGTPTQNGMFSITVTATDGNGCTGQNTTYTLTISCSNTTLVTSNADSGAGSLRDVIARVCPGSTITFASNVTGEILLASGQLVIDKDLTIQGPGAAALTLRNTAASSPTSRVLHVSSGTVSITGLTFTGGNPNGTGFGCGGSTCGGGINNLGALTLTECVVRANTISGAARGGGIYNQGTLNLHRSTVADNTLSANTPSGNDGGGIFNQGTVNLSHSTISGNVNGGVGEQSGGGIKNQGGTMRLSNCTISGNQVSGTHGNGGGIASNSGTLTLSHCTVFGNSVTSNLSGICRGGGILGNVIAHNTIIAGNTFSGNGSNRGPDVLGTLTSLGYSLIGNNADATITPTTGDKIGGGTTPVIDAKLGPLADNGGPTETHALLDMSPALNAGGDATTLNGAITGNATSLTLNNAAAFPVGSVLQIDSEQMTVTAVTNNTLTITRGTNNTAATSHNDGAGVNFAFDQRGLGFPRKVGSAPDIGAFEVQNNAPTLTLNTTAPSLSQGSQMTGVALGSVNDVESAVGGLQVAVTSANPSNGVTLAQFTNSNGLLAATLQAACTATTTSFTLAVQDEAGAITTATLNVTVTPNTAPTLSYPSNPGTSFGTGLTINPLAPPTDNGSIQSFQVYSIVPALASGITVNSAGVVTVTGTVPANTYTVTIRATDNCGLTKDASFTLGITRLTSVITWTPPAFLLAGPLSPSVLNAAANTPGSFSYTPAAGTVLGPGTVTLTANFTPSSGNYNPASQSVTLPVLDNSCGLTVNPATLPTATRGTPFVQTLSASPTGSYVFSILSGQLPPGVSLVNTLGIYSLRGTPTTTGSYTFTIKAKKNNSTCEGARTYTVVVP